MENITVIARRAWHGAWGHGNNCHGSDGAGYLGCTGRSVPIIEASQCCLVVFEKFVHIHTLAVFLLFVSV